ncbi:hypothetical protein SALBM311S_12513 [Streptomyces alboniger]
MSRYRSRSASMSSSHCGSRVPQRVERGHPGQRYVTPLGGEGVVDAGVPDEFEASGGQSLEEHDPVGVGVRREVFQQAPGEFLRGAHVDQRLTETAEGGEVVARAFTVVHGVGVGVGVGVGIGRALGCRDAGPVRRVAGRGEGGTGLMHGATQRRHQAAQGYPALLRQRAVGGLGSPPQFLDGLVRVVPVQRHQRALGPLQDGGRDCLVPQPVHLGTLPGNHFGQRNHFGLGAGFGGAGGLARHTTSIAHQARFDHGPVAADRTHR